MALEGSLHDNRTGSFLDQLLPASQVSSITSAYHGNRDMCKTLASAMKVSPKELGSAFLWQWASLVNKQYDTIEHEQGESSLRLCDGTQLSCTALALYMRNKKWISAEQLNMFFACFEFKQRLPDVIVFVHNCPDQDDAFSFICREWDDYYFELMIKAIASLTSSSSAFRLPRWLVRDCSREENNRGYLREMLYRCVRGRIRSPSIFWDPALSSPALDASEACFYHRIMYQIPEEITGGLEMLSSGKMDTYAEAVALIHISLWMKPNRQAFQRLVIAHLSRQHDIVFYARGALDCDPRASSIVKWIFTSNDTAGSFD